MAVQPTIRISIICANSPRSKPTVASRRYNLEVLFQQTGDEKWVSPKTLREMVSQGYLGDPSPRTGSKGGYYEYLVSRR